ncbi:hypothetical protein HD554DRAFT_2030941 [Boletus coccyginus]|nr:hypothetical protein HD554DRAFT_2030941 [Boletus coccyginus]
MLTWLSSADDELLERKVTRAEDVLDALQRRANELYRPEPTLDTTIDRAPPQAEAEWVKQSRRATAALDTDPEDKYDMDPTSLVLFAIELFDIRKDREEAFEYFVRAWHKAHQPFVTMKLVTHYLPLHIPLNMIDADEEQQLGTMSYYLECIGGPPGLAQLFLEAGLLHLEGATSVLSASSSTTSSIPIPPLPRPGEGGTQARNRDREMASRYFDRAKALHPGVDVPRIPDNDISQAALGNIHELEMPELEMPPIEIQPSALESVYSGEDSLCSKQQMLVHRRRKKKEELVLLDEVKEKEDIENAWHLDVPSLVGVGTALLVAGVIGALRLSWRRN